MGYKPLLVTSWWFFTNPIEKYAPSQNEKKHLPPNLSVGEDLQKICELPPPTLRKINMEPENTLLEKENHLNQTIMTSGSENRGTPKSSILIGISIINHPWGTTIFGNMHINLRGFFAYDWVDESHPYHRIDPPHGTSWIGGIGASKAVFLASWISFMERHLLGCGGQETTYEKIATTVDGRNPKQPPGMYKTL